MHVCPLARRLLCVDSMLPSLPSRRWAWDIGFGFGFGFDFFFLFSFLLKRVGLGRSFSRLNERQFFSETGRMTTVVG